MKQFVFTMKDDVCTQHNKTEAQKQEVLKVLTHYGSVEDFDAVLSTERAKYQEVIDNQTKQIEAIKEQELTQDEMAMVRAYRIAISGVVAEHKAVEADCRKTIATLEETLSQFKNRIIAIVGE